MTQDYAYAQAMKLTVDERLELVGRIWESIAADVADSPLSPDQEQEIRRRIAEADPSQDMPWDEFHAELRRK
jgi:putative addiction module component (TIGR02574 family)